MLRLALIAAALIATPVLAQDEPTETAVAPQPPAASATLTLTLESRSDIERTIALYQCESGTLLNVQYVNAAPNSLALVPVDGEVHVFATTLSASGARYVSGPFEWWSSGDEATLRDLTQGEDADPLETCTQSSNTP